MIKREGLLPITARTLLILFLLFLAVTGIQASKFWHRSPMVFYLSSTFPADFFLPIEVVKGDTIDLNSGEYIITIQHDERIDSITYGGDNVSLNCTRHMTLWELITNNGGNDE